VETEKIKVLLVDDDQGDFEMIRVMLANAEHQDFQLDWVSSYEEAIDALKRDEYDVYFLDYFLEDMTGLDLLREARNRGITAPIIMLTGRGSRTVDMEAMELGASDYLVKGLIDPDALERSVRHAMERERGNRAIKEIETRQATKDARGEPGPIHLGVDERAAMFGALFESSRSGVAIVGFDGVVLESNPAFTDIFPPGSMGPERSFLDLLDASDREPVAKELEALATGEMAKFQSAKRFLDTEGQLFWAHTTTALIRGADGGPGQLLLVLERAQGEA
jgi:PAS domain S-box-containing protein